MKLQIVTDQGELIETIEDVQDYNLDKSIPAADLLDEIKRAIKMGEGKE